MDHRRQHGMDYAFSQVTGKWLKIQLTFYLMALYMDQNRKRREHN